MSVKELIGDKMRKARADPLYPLVAEDEPAYVRSKGWEEMICNIYEVDPLLCPSCGGLMSIISFIDNHNVINRIIRHLE